MKTDKKDQEYINSFKNWIKGQDNAIEQVHANIDNSSRLIKIHQQSLKISKDTLEVENNFRSRHVNAYNEWCADNDYPEHQIKTNV